MKKAYTSLVTYIKAHPKIDLLFLGLGLAAFLAITLINAPRASIWFDEAFSAYIARFSFWDIARYTASDVHPPFYYWLLKVWGYLFGTSDLANRSLSIALGAGVISVATLLTRKLFGRKVGLTALLFLVLSPMLIRYSDEARMYTLASLIVFAATYVMLRARETNSRKLWAAYGVLVSVGMWTHYFTALAWIAHWLWHAFEVYRKGMRFRELWKATFTKEWVFAYIVAVAVYLPWLPFMALQLGIVQGGGFWIGPVTIDTPANYFSNAFYYLEHGEVQSWLALLLMAILVLLAVLTPRVYKTLRKKEKLSFMLIALLAWVPPLLLIFASMPPLRSSFVERYMLPAIVAFSVFTAVVLVVGTKRWRPVLRALPILVVAGMMIFGITNVYKYGNFNKSTSYHVLTREVIDEIHEAGSSGQPIVTQSPWIFYESIPYATDDYPVFFIDATADYKMGSLAMFKDQDQFKITDMDAFEEEHQVIWYIGQSEADGPVPPYDDSWKALQTVSVTDDITGRTIYRATQYQVR